MPNLLKKLEISSLFQWLVLGFLMSSVVLVLPFGTNPIEMGKLLTALLLCAISFWLVSSYVVKQKKLSLPTHPLTTVLLLLAATTMVSTLLATSHPLAQLIGFGGSWFGFFTLSILGGMILKHKSTPNLVATLTTMGGIGTIVSTLELVGLKVSSLYAFLLGTPFPEGVGFSPAGSAFIVAQLCLLAIIACFSAAQHLPQQKNLFLAGAAINLVGLLITGWLCLPGHPANPVILPWSANWSIAIDSLREPRTALLGLGPDNFTNAYTRYKPNWMNNTNWWNVEFTQASNLPFSIITTLGIVTFATWIYFYVTFIKNSKKWYALSPLATTLTGAGLLLLLVVPPTTFMLLTVAICLAFLIADTKDAYPLVEQNHGHFQLVANSLWHKLLTRLPFPSQHATGTKIFIATATGLLGLAIFVGTVQLARAEFGQFQANQQTIKGNFVQLYELQKNAISINPYNDVARRNYALTNLAIASAVSNKADIADEDMQKIAVLVQQSIREAKAAVLINPQKAQNWETLGDIYTNFIGAMEGSDSLALEAYRQALQYSPANPNLYIKLGGVFYRQADYTNAILAFEQAAIAKPDLANAYYNAANAFRELKDYSKSENAYKQTLVVLEQAGGSSSEEYLRTNLELEELQKQTATTSANLEN